MLTYVYDSLYGFRKVFSRHRTWLIFVMIVLGFIGSSEMTGVSSFCRFWLIDNQGYHTLLRFFRSSAWELSGLLEHWAVFAVYQQQTICSQGRVVTLGDHTYVPKEGRRMPGVVTLRQDSETQSKPSYFRGQCWGGLALAVGGMTTPFALPLNLRLHQGSIHLGEAKKSSLTLGEQMVQMAIDFSLQTNQGAVLVLDAFFSVGPVFLLAQATWLRSIKAPAVHIITKAKKNYVGYFQADPSCYTGMGRPSQYGEHIHLAEVFDHLYLFQKVSVRIYGHMEEICIYYLDLLWKPTKGSLRFVFAKTSRGPIVLMCSNLDQDPIAAIELYCLRTRIETMFDMLKNVLHIFQCHFWSKKMPKHSRKPKSNKTQQAPQAENAKTVQACWDATERFVSLGAISLGLLQLIALKFPEEIWSRFEGFLRTRSRYIPSERTVKMVIANLLVQDFLKVAPTATMREIRAKIIKGRFKKKIIQTEDHVYQRAA
ncbi:MAG: hypothetical protein D3925_02020 [Candidatus Electrothrix sp. AR5]|nr:hypothetical protein [Candidatus Electrothrix sp. AR5]